ncbi:MAG: cytochrome c biogenesis protein CcsA [Thermoguttaceae bacterium]
MSGVSVICFAASYAVALALEISRLWFRSGWRGVLMIGFAAAGWAAHTAFLCHQAVAAPGVPLSSERDWFLMAAWALAAVYLYLAVGHPKTPFGLFLLPLVLALVGAARFAARTEALAQPRASAVWGTMHGASIVLAAVAVLIGFAAGVMYLTQSRRLKQNRPTAGGWRWPSLEWLQWANSRAILVSLVMLAVGVVSGMILNRIQTDGATRLTWTDPVVLTTWLLFLWLLAAAILGALYRPALAGRKVAYLTLVSFLFLAILLVVGLLVDSRHWRRAESGASKVTDQKIQSPFPLPSPLSPLHFSRGGRHAD